jgi:hypothetical protein
MELDSKERIKGTELDQKDMSDDKRSEIETDKINQQSISDSNKDSTN